MSNFRTKIDVPSSSLQLSHHNSLLFIGSCFTENIGSKLKKLKFEASINPTGILYNPESIAQLIQRLIEGRLYLEEELNEKSGIWHSFDHHSVFSSTQIASCLTKINAAFKEGEIAIKKCKTLFITFGSAHLYFLKETNRLVSNCHKYPSSFFIKTMFDLNQSFEHFKFVLSELKKMNQNISVILTLSPVRYLSDGFIKNQHSKSMLHLLCQQLKECFDWVEYFPAYEIMMDDLRDYRFYSDDMIHPSNQAVNYIFDVFKKVYFSAETQQLLLEVETIVKASEHRVFFEGSEEHRKFNHSMIQKIEKLNNHFPFLDFKKEKEIFLNP